MQESFLGSLSPYCTIKTMRAILEQIEKVVPKLKHVSINHEAIEDFASKVSTEQLAGTEYNEETLLQDVNEEEFVAFAFVYNSVNFSYWGSPKWTIEIDSEKYDGSAAMIRAICRGRNEIDLLKPEILAELKSEQLERVLRGNIKIPLFEERLRLLNILGKTIRDGYGSSFLSFVHNAGWDAEKLTLKLAEEIPEVFNDTAYFHGHKINFYKRAQLVPTHLRDIAGLDKLSMQMHDCEKLTAFADYKVPQLMRHMGILSYDDVLASKVDKYIELEPSSEKELEMRIATIWANELAAKKVRKRIESATATQVCSAIWFASQSAGQDVKLYHRTRTIWY